MNAATARETTSVIPAAPRILDAAWLRALCLAAGADDAGFVEVDRPALASERPHIAAAFPRTRSMISLVVRMNNDTRTKPCDSFAVRCVCAALPTCSGACRFRFNRGRLENWPPPTILPSPVRNLPRPPCPSAPANYKSSPASPASQTSASPPIPKPGWGSWPGRRTSSGRCSPGAFVCRAIPSGCWHLGGAF